MWVGLGVSFLLVALLFGMSYLVPEPRHHVHLDVAFGSFTQLIHATRGFFCTNNSQTYQALEWRAWGVMLPLGWDYGSRQQYVQIYPWIFGEIHHLLITGWLEQSMSYDVTDWLHIAHWNAQQKCRSCQWTLGEVHRTRSMPPL